MSFTTTQMKVKRDARDFQNLYPVCAKHKKITLSASEWSAEKTQVVSISAELMQNFSGWAPESTSLKDYKAAGILLVAKDNVSLTFSAETVPIVDIVISVISL